MSQPSIDRQTALVKAPSQYTFEVGEGGPDELLLGFKPDVILALADTIRAVQKMPLFAPYPEEIQVPVYGWFSDDGQWAKESPSGRKARALLSQDTSANAPQAADHV